MKKKSIFVFAFMALLGSIAGVFYFQMFNLLDSELNTLFSIILFIGGLVLLNLLINRVLPLDEYPVSHPTRILGYAVFVIVLLSTVSVLSS
ncbi:hypothetical protein [Jeotgalibacillus proteolyticus]|uniref:hypothetical protein n=1 Tax=Jeotgalibacillus proteolyticus TaxID=2082395 RepID=UPI003CF3C1D7